ncbi:hypothetical protein [Aliiroseovarius sp.]|uniref:hypothetical protein n=1 Tax=Aliiroseovarius sp. TaxID=1872442 RepID=UPI003BABB83B
MNLPKSISIDQLNEAAEKAVRSVLGDELDTFGRPAIGFLPDIGTVGLIWNDPDFTKFDASKMVEISAKITDAMGPLAANARPVATLTKGGATAGYFPVGPVILRDML